MSDTPEQQTVHENDPREELPMLQPVTTIYDAYVENEPGWDGEGLYTDLETAKRYSAAEYVLEAWGTDSAGPLTWRFERGFWDLLDDGRATGVIVTPREVFGTKPDEQPQADDDVRAVAALLDADASGEPCCDEFDALRARFADRIDALDARDAKAGEQR